MILMFSVYVRDVCERERIPEKKMENRALASSALQFSTPTYTSGFRTHILKSSVRFLS